MYILAILILVGIALGLFALGGVRNNKLLIGLGASILALTALVFSLLDFWGEMLWFDNLGFSRRFWSVIISRIGFGLLGACLGAGIVYLLTLPLKNIQKINPISRYWPEILAALFGSGVGSSSWDIILRFFNRVQAGVLDPVLEKDLGFYLFTLPFLDIVYSLLLLWVWIALLASLASIFVRLRPQSGFSWNLPSLGGNYYPVYLNLGVGLIVYGFGQYLNIFHLMYSRLGIVSGPGWTDVHVRMPSLRVLAFVSIASGICLLIPRIRKLMRRVWRRFSLPHKTSDMLAGLTPVLLVLLVYMLGLNILPPLLQWLRVEPNEITMERSYIKNNIDFTRRAFGLQDIEVKPFPMSGDFDRPLVERNQDLLSDVRLWDWLALKNVYRQFQEIRLYYKFDDVDMDRYQLGDGYHQVMVSAREMDLTSLPDQSKTFINKRFKYTHGYGMTMARVNEFTPQGLPNLLLRDIPPKATYTSLHLTNPEIYYGELTRSPVVVNSKEKEFDYPKGDNNVYAHYQGRGGVKLDNFWRKFVYGWMFDGSRFLLSGYPRPESRIMFHRQVRERVQRLAPFLRFENDAYIVNHDGRQYWIIDAYTVSSQYPYSEPLVSATGYGNARGWRQSRLGNSAAIPELAGFNYVRNSVKVVVDAYDGDVNFYVFNPDDPIIKCWQNIFPALFQDAAEMPPGLRSHVRYPSAFLLAQGLVYAKYHMTDPEVFYNQEDLWVRATEKYYQSVIKMKPYYIMWKTGDKSKPQFSVILPFTPKDKQVMIGWLAGLCDGENYGRLLAYKFPKEMRVLGPQQVETKIDQDPFLSGQLTLWDQRGSKVIRGNLLAIPIEESIVYVEPIYLQSETAAYPELRLVAVMNNDELSYADSFSAAIEGLLDGKKRKPAGITKQETTGETSELGRKANRAFNEYLRLQGEKKFKEASSQLAELQKILQQLAGDRLGKPEEREEN